MVQGLVHLQASELKALKGIAPCTRGSVFGVAGDRSVSMVIFVKVYLLDWQKGMYH